MPGGEHHQSHDRLAVDFFTVFFDPHVGLKTVGGLNKEGCRTGMQAVTVEDD